MGAKFVPYGRTDGRTDMMKLIVAFQNFVNENENMIDLMDGGLNCLQESCGSTTVLCTDSRATKTPSLLLYFNIVLVWIFVAKY